MTSSQRSEQDADLFSVLGRLSEKWDNNKRTLSLNGSQLTVPTLAWILSEMERGGHVEIRNIAPSPSFSLRAGAYLANSGRWRLVRRIKAWWYSL